MRKLILVIAALLTYAITVLPMQVLAEEEPVRELTLMIYMAGSTLESGSDGTEGQAATNDIDEILKSGVDTERINVVLMTGGASDWFNGQDAGETLISRMGNRRQLISTPCPSVMNMGAADTLGYFLNYSREKNPAKAYALILWDHGNGPMEGVCFDELRGMDGLSLDELSKGLALGGFGDEDRLAWIGFDACLMAAVETASACTPYARYMIASQDKEPGGGWDYSFLANTDAMVNGAEIGRIIIDGFMAASDDKYRLTLSCVDLDAMREVFSAMDALFEALSDRLSSKTFSTMSNSRQRARSFGRATASAGDLDLVDLYSLSEQYGDIAKAEAETLQAALNRAIVYSQTNRKGAHGLSLYSPMYNKSKYKGKWRRTYEGAGFSAAYSKFMDDYADIWLGAQLSDWSRLKYRALPLNGQGFQTVELTLDDSQLANYGSARLIILRDAGDGSSYYNINEISDVRLSGNTLRADYDYSALHVMDENGKPMTDAYPFQRVDEYYYVYVMLEAQSMFNLTYLYDSDMGRANYTSRGALLQCVRPEGSDVLEVVNIIIYPNSDEELILGRQNDTLNAAEWPYMFFNYPGQLIAPAYDENGNTLSAIDWSPAENIVDGRMMYVLDPNNDVLAPRDWVQSFSADLVEQNGYRLWGEVETDKPWTLRFVEEPYNSLDLFAQYIITDSQGNEYATELIPLDKPSQLSTQDMDVAVLGGRSADVRLTRIETNNSALDRGVTLRVNVKNKTSDIVYFGMTGLIINNIPVDFFAASTAFTWSNSTSELYINVPADKLPPLKDGMIHSISFIPYMLQIPMGYMAANVPLDRYQMMNSTGFQYADMVTLKTELDVSVLNPMRAWPYGSDILGQSDAQTEQGIRLELADLREQADGTLAGVLHIINESDKDRNVIAGDAAATIPQMAINRCIMYNALSTFTWLAMPAGSDTYVDFTVDRTSASRGLLNTSGNGKKVMDIFDYWGISSVESLDFLLYISNDINTSAAKLAALATGQASEIYGISSCWTQQYLHIPLDSSVALAHTQGSREPVLPLARGGIDIDLHGVKWDGRYAWIYVDLRPEEGTQMLKPVSGEVDKQSAAPEIMIDIVSNANIFLSGSVPITDGISQQAIIRLDAGLGKRSWRADAISAVMDVGSDGLRVFEIVPISGAFQMNDYMPASLLSVKRAPN